VQSFYDTWENHVESLTMLLLKHKSDSDPSVIERFTLDVTDTSGRIRCPHCEWQPTPSDRWMCSCADTPEPYFEACGTVWNTFSTRGRCPGCQHQWRWTSCLACGEWALHEQWYEARGPETTPS
jgi:hypothetical protein